MPINNWLSFSLLDLKVFCFFRVLSDKVARWIIYLLLMMEAQKYF